MNLSKKLKTKASHEGLQTLDHLDASSLSIFTAIRLHLCVLIMNLLNLPVHMASHHNYVFHKMLLCRLDIMWITVISL